MRCYRIALCAAMLALIPSVTKADIVTDWNQVALDSIIRQKLVATSASRALAMVHAAVFDAVNTVDKTYEPYLVPLQAPSGTSPEVAAAVAAHGVLTSLFPAQSAILDAALADSLAPFPDGPGKTSGIALGAAAADIVVSWRLYDHSSDMVHYTPGTGPGRWRPTPPAFGMAMMPQWATVTPFALQRGSQLRPTRPPALGSTEYLQAWYETKTVGAKDSTVRTAEQTAIAKFWVDMPGTETTVGRWNLVARSVAGGNSLAQNARLFALLNIAMADAGVVGWDCKYAYNFWRPIAAIREADTDGNPRTVADPTWEPLVTTPAFPGYVSTHSTFSATAATVLSSFFGTDNKAFEIVGFNGSPERRAYTSFSQAAREAGMSRIYGGIHFRFEDSMGQAVGKRLGTAVYRYYLRRVR